MHAYMQYVMHTVIAHSNYEKIEFCMCKVYRPITTLIGHCVWLLCFPLLVGCSV